MDFHKDFVEEGLLGSGTFADVYRVRQRLGVNSGGIGGIQTQGQTLQGGESEKDDENTLAQRQSMQQHQSMQQTMALGRLYAVKKSKRQFRSKKDREWLLREVKSMQTISDHAFSYNNNKDGSNDDETCPYVLQLVQAWQENGYFFVQIELVSICCLCIWVYECIWVYICECIWVGGCEWLVYLHLLFSLAHTPLTYRINHACAYT